ncbi:MAG TPA: hypothetical protein EYQ64_00375, partial [Gemmatimonadetes bacterium]|nr:hypothetical protein [Gemmatimonadota bacterium]
MAPVEGSSMNKREHFLAFVTRIKHEAPYIREWLEYHLLVGVEHFFLYDMDEGSTQAEALEPYVEAGAVTRIPWSHFEGTRLDRKRARFRHNKSSLAHRHFALNFRDRVCWAQKIDGDEFLYPLAGNDVVGPLQAYDPKRVRAVRFPRFNFGTETLVEGIDIMPLVIGAFVERMKFLAVMLFSALWLIVVYLPICHMQWGGGWFASQGVMDFAGGIVVHITAGV